jgi:hypothetical protein
VTLFTRVGDAFSAICAGVTAAMILYPLAKRKLVRRKG